MKLLRVTFSGVRGLRDATIDFTNPETGAPHDVVLVTGPAASGKTRMLEAIIAAKEVVAPYGPTVWPDPWVGESGAAKVVLAFYLSEEERTFAGTSEPVAEAEAMFRKGAARAVADDGLRAVLDRYSHEARAGKIEYFAATRQIPAHPASTELKAGAQRAQRPIKTAQKYAFVSKLLRAIALRPEEARAFAERLAALSPTCRYELAPLRCFTSRGEAPVTVDELSDSERDAVIFAATAVAINLNCSLVLVDRPDLHFHAGLPDAARLLAGLRALGDDNQLLLAPGSPAPFAAAGGAYTIELEAP